MRGGCALRICFDPQESAQPVLDFLDIAAFPTQHPRKSGLPLKPKHNSLCMLSSATQLHPVRKLPRVVSTCKQQAKRRCL